jgi:hypothetical protein
LLLLLLSSCWYHHPHDACSTSSNIGLKLVLPLRLLHTMLLLLHLLHMPCQLGLLLLLLV